MFWNLDLSSLSEHTVAFFSIKHFSCYEKSDVKNCFIGAGFDEWKKAIAFHVSFQVQPGFYPKIYQENLRANENRKRVLFRFRNKISSTYNKWAARKNSKSWSFSCGYVR